jgi:hypothetical protein
MQVVADINPRGIRMDHFQTEVFTLDFSRQLPPLLAIHPVPYGLGCKVVGFSFGGLLVLPL